MTLAEYKQALYLAKREARLEQMRRHYAASRERLVEYQRQYRVRSKAATGKEPTE